MDTSDDGTSFEPPRPADAPPSGPPLLPPPSPAGQPPFSSPPVFTPDAGTPTAVVVPTGTAGKRSKGKVVGGLVAVVALLGAGGFAVTKVISGDDGGAASPTEVGTQLMDSLGAEDALGVVDLLLPGERDTFRQPLVDLVENLKRLAIVDNSTSLDKVGGLDIAFEDVQVDTTETNVDDISDIRITATSTASINGDEVPIGDLLIDEAFGGDRPEIDDSSQDSDVDWQLATVKRDGRWYLSAFYSIAENARAGVDIPEEGVVARGADSPEGAVQAILDAVDDLDLEALIASLNPNEADALQRYAPMFLGEAQDALDDVDAKITLSEPKFTVIGSGDRRTVTLDHVDLDAVIDGESVKIENKDGCTVVTSGDTTTNTCEAAGSIDDVLGMLGLDDNEDVKSLVTTVQEAFSDLGPIGVTVQKVGGKWYVSPIGTYFDILLAELKALDKDELTDIIDGVKKVAESLSSEGGIFGIDPTLGGIGDIDVGGGDSDGGVSGDTIPGDTIPDDSDTGDIDTSGFEKCFDESTYEGYSGCLLAGIDDGSIDPTFVAPYIRFPDCGVGERYWNGDVYTMSDEEFTAFATEAAPCFQQHVDEGAIDEFELPYELSRPDCLEGRNWYNVTDDDDYGARIFDCVTG